VACRLSRIFRNANQEIRSGFVVAGFAVCVFLCRVVYAIFLGFFDIPDAQNLDDPNIFFGAFGTFFSGTVSTIICFVIFRTPLNIEHPHPLKEVGLGAGFALLLLLFSVGVSTAFGFLRFSVLQPVGASFEHGVLQFVILSPAAFGEELIMRGAFFWLLVRRGYPKTALFLTGIVFGLLHVGNPNISPFAVANIALVGLLFGLITIRTKSVWRAIGLHVTWNFAEGFLLGLPVSGVQPNHAFLTAEYGSANFFSGGPFGPEASGVTSVALILACAVELKRKAQGQTE
jgi:uncharacterized protein